LTSSLRLKTCGQEKEAALHALDKGSAESWEQPVSIALVAVFALGDFPGAFTEGFWRGALDEVAIPLVTLAGIAWYWKNRYSRSLMPAAIIAAAIAFKVVAVFIEDKDDVGDDFGAAIVYGLSLIIWTVIYYRTRTSASADAALPARSTPEKQPAVVRVKLAWHS
jgi:hypothetical protein